MTMTWTPRIILDGSSRVDEKRKLVVFRKARVWNGRARYDTVHRKADGFRVMFYLGSGGDAHAFTTKPRDMCQEYPEHPLWRDLAARLMREQFVDGELHVPGEGREYVKTALAQGDPRLQLAVFATSWHRGSESILSMNRDLRREGFTALPAARTISELSEIERCSDDGSGERRCYDGYVFKDSMYGDWAKHKNVRTADLVVTGITPGCGKYTGQCGSLHGSVWAGEKWVEVCRCSGMDDDIRAMISSDDINRVFEVAYEKVGSAGRLQHPRFTRWRDDEKRYDECTIDQDPLLVRYHHGA